MQRRDFLQTLAIASTLRVAIDAPADAASSNLNGSVDYLFRYFIRSEKIREQTAELIAYCKGHHIRDVILFSGNHWSMGWNLPTISEAKERVALLRPTFAALREAGLTPSINIWTTVGHGDFGRDERRRFDWQFMVGDDGSQCKAIPCPIDPKYVAHITEVYRLFATLQPHYMYIDDDFRLYFNHEPANWSCYCPLHLKAIGKRTSKNWSRRALLAALLAPPTEKTVSLRKAWLALLGDSEVALARALAAAVQSSSPRTHMGLMCSGPNAHAAVGRRWTDLYEALSRSGSEPALRPTFADYNDGDPRYATAYICNMRKLLPLLGQEMRITPELESDPDTRFAKSNRYTRLQMALSFFLAGPALTLDVKPFTDTHLLTYATSVDFVLNESYAYFATLATLAGRTPHERGLQIMWDNRFPLHRNASGSSYGRLAQPEVWEGALDILGFATTFYAQRGVKLASRGYLEERTDDELRELLRGPLVIDGDAATVLLERGFGSHIGVAAIAPIEGCNYERVRMADFARRSDDPVLSTIAFDKYQLHPLAGVVEVSRMYGPEMSFSVPGMVLYKNSGGGRIAILPFNGSAGNLLDNSFRDWKRQYALRKIFEWIALAPVPLLVENAPNAAPFRRDGDGEVVVAIANLGFDSIGNATFRIGSPFAENQPRVEYALDNGRLKAISSRTQRDGPSIRIETGVEVPPLTVAAFRVTG